MEFPRLMETWVEILWTRSSQANLSRATGVNAARYYVIFVSNLLKEIILIPAYKMNLMRRVESSRMPNLRRELGQSLQPSFAVSFVPSVTAEAWQ